MKEFSIKGEKRNRVGRKDSQKLRRNEYVPCVIYGGEGNVHFTTPLKYFNNLVYTPNVYLINLDISGEKHYAMLQDVQFHPVTDKVIHADFYEVYEDRPVTINLPTKLVGSSPGVVKGGYIREKRRSIQVRGLPRNLPDYLEIDISKLDVGQNIHLGDLSYENLEIMDPHEAMIVTVISPKKLEKALADAEAAAEAAAEGVPEEPGLVGEESEEETQAEESESSGAEESGEEE